MTWIGGAKAATTWQSDTVEVAKVAASLAWKAALARIAWLVLLFSSTPRMTSVVEFDTTDGSLAVACDRVTDWLT
jgi:hypothetical protein